LRTKDEALDYFKINKDEVENQLERKIKRLRSDRGGEYFPKGKISILVPQLSTKGQVGPSTLKSANPVLHLFLGQVRPLTFKTVNLVPQVLFLDQVHPSGAHFVNI